MASRQLPISSQVLTATGGADGYATVASNAGFWTGSTVTLMGPSGTPPGREARVTDTPGTTRVGLVFLDETNHGTTRSNLSAYPSGSALTQPAQVTEGNRNDLDRQGPPEQDTGGPGGPATQIVEAGGPTTLSVGAIADGQATRRVGATFVGYTPTDADEHVKISSSDTTSGHLVDKLVQGAGAVLAILNSGLNEELEVSVPGIAVLNARNLTAGTGLTGGGTLAADRSFALAAAGAGAGAYGTAGVTSLTIDAYGRVTAVGVLALVPQTRQVVAGTGLSGGGALTGDVTLTNDVLTGKAGGQTWAGGTGAGEDVTITSTTHATKGTIRLNGAAFQINGVSYVLPASQGAASSVLFNDGAGNLSWSTSFVTAPPVIIDATGLTTTVPMTIRNAKSQSGIELQATLASSAGATGYCLLDSGAVRRGYIGLATLANNWISGTLVNDIVIEAISASVRIRGLTAVHLSSPSNNFNVTTSGYLRLDDSVGSQFGFNASNIIATTANLAYTVGAAASGTHIFAHNLVKTATAGTIAGIQLSTFSAGPSSGSAAIRALDLACTVNQTGSASGAVTGIYLAVTETSVLGTHDLIHLKAGAAATTTLFKVDNSGSMQTATAALATGATTGFWLCRTMAGTPTGAVADGCIVLDTTAGKWWARTGGAWKGILLV